MTDVPVNSVTEITRQIKDLLEANLGTVCVRGEISNCTRASSGHVYLTLKDDASQLRAVIWRSAASRLKFDLHDGLDVIAMGAIEVYGPRGAYQLIIRQLMPQGVGPLELAFRQLQQKLAAEGLFDERHKQPLPRFPRCIALVTSPTGAAVRDMLQVIGRRWKNSRIVIIPVAVQGEDAARQIATALQLVPNLPDVDVIITGRGGGSLEDLWAFNEEIVARTIFACPIPVVSAVGHEIDVSIADLVADCRALTPSEAGELVVPDAMEVVTELHRLRDRLVAGLRDRSHRSRLLLETLAARRVLAHPFDRIHDRTTQLDELDARLRRATIQRLKTAKQNMAQWAGTLEALSPIRVLQRGYSITQHAQTKELITAARQLELGDRIVTRFESGQAISRVESVETISPNEPGK